MRVVGSPLAQCDCGAGLTPTPGAWCYAPILGMSHHERWNGNEVSSSKVFMSIEHDHPLPDSVPGHRGSSPGEEWQWTVGSPTSLPVYIS